MRQQVSSNTLVICGVSKIESLSTNYELLVIASGASSKMVIDDLSKDKQPEEKEPNKAKPETTDIFDIPAFIRNQVPAPCTK
ncbi:hypothetical protein CWB58_14355 [Pseudoalteromonas sp. S201]|uniref:hypothetical protein n=1 Tax=unclassified Pseudoalteromonas TaxID=194690 RepID=UPI000413DAED|nr:MULTISPECIES: hypothetical protein [unclassified Pseudoalteromonas]TMS92426.1 hypothetical protein CWB58_14355 [Pseudoalteromonas sp. S201]